jgi:hypothetical protein
LSLVRDTAAPELAVALEAGLHSRYRQYADTPFLEILAFRIERVAGWSAG